MKIRAKKLTLFLIKIIILVITLCFLAPFGVDWATKILVIICALTWSITSMLDLMISIQQK